MGRVKNILITGGAGYIGSVLVQKLVAAKHEWSTRDFASRKESPWAMPWEKIVIYDNLMYKQTPLLNYMYRGDIDFVHADVTDSKRLAEEVKKADCVVPLAALVGATACDKNPYMAQSINVGHIEMILQCMNDGTKVIYPNTNSGYGIGAKDTFCTEQSPLNPISLYGKTKCQAEELVLNAGGVSFRLATVFGVSQRMRIDLLVNDFVLKAVTDGYIVLFEKDFKRNYIHIQDVALAFLRAMIDYDTFKGQAFNLGLSKANLSKLELAQKVKMFVPNFSIQIDEFSKDKDQRNYIVSNEKLEATGWKPYYSLETGIEELIKAYKIIGPSRNEYTNK